MEEMVFNCKFNARGFTPGVDITNEKWQEAVQEFAAMYDLYAKSCNEITDRLNETWEKYEDIMKNDRILGTNLAELTRSVMGISENTTYCDYMEIWFKQICDMVDDCAKTAGFYIRSNLFRENDCPIFGGKFLDHPDWTIDMSLELTK